MEQLRVVRVALGVTVVTTVVTAFGGRNAIEAVSEPCCGVLSVDRARGLVTAFELETGNVFTFTVRNRSTLANVKPCQRFEADVSKVSAGQGFAARLGAENRAQVDRGEPCCTMKSAPGTAGTVAVQQHARFEDVEIILLDVKRDAGGTATANCLYCNNGAKVVDLAADMRARVREAKLLDAENRVDHRVMRTGGNAGEAMASNHGAGLKLGAGQSVRTWMKFTLPASRMATLVVPGAAVPFENISITP